MPGPASTVEKHSLYNISSEGTAVRSPAEGYFFSDRETQFMFDGNSDNSDGFFQSRNLDLEKAVATTTTV